MMINKKNSQESQAFNLTRFVFYTLFTFTALLISPTMVHAAGACTTGEIALTGDGSFSNLYRIASSSAMGDIESNNIGAGSLGNYFAVMNDRGRANNPDAWIGPVSRGNNTPASTKTANGTPASPDGSVFVGLQAGFPGGISASLGKSVGIKEYFPIENLMVGGEYKVQFYQVNAGNRHTRSGSIAHIAVQFNDEIKLSPAMSYSGVGGQRWQLVTLNFTATSPTLSTLAFTAYGGADGDMVTVNDSTGSYQVPADYMGIDGIKLFGPTCTTPATLSGVTDINSASNTVAEGAPTGSTVGVTAKAVHSYGSGVTYSLTNSANGLFTINPQTGVISVTRSPTNGTYTVTVSATSGGLTRTGNFTITVPRAATLSGVTDINSASNTVAEGAPTGSTVGVTANATHSGGSNVTYSLTNNANGLFTINPQTGVISVTRSPTNGTYNVTVSATAGGLTQTGNFTITVPRKPPTLSELVDKDSRENKVNEDAASGILVGITASATHSDLLPVTYTILNNVKDKFDIESKTGKIFVLGELDYDEAKKYDILVEAKSPDGLIKVGVFTVEIEEVPDVLTPIIDTDPRVNQVSENSPVGTPAGVTVETKHTGGLPVTYSFISDASGFSVDSKTGVITVSDELNYHTAKQHTLLIQATTEDGLIQIMSVTIDVRDELDKISTIVDDDAQANQIDESALTGSKVGITASAFHSAFLPLAYSLTNDAGGLFAINRETGVVTVAGNIDYEKARQHEITVRAGASDGLVQTQSFIIDVQNSKADSDNPVGSITDIDKNTNEVPENTPLGSTVGITALAKDPDGDTVEYQLTEDANGLFTIDPNTGVVTTKALIDYEKAKTHSITIQATSADGSTSQETINLSVVDDPSDNGVRLRIVALLQGSFDSKTGLMKDNLLTQGVLPYTQPYSAAPYHYKGKEELTKSLIANLVDDHAIIDWVLIELRDKNDPLKVLAAQAALLTANGDVVNMAGEVQLVFETAPADDYYVTLRHRNHLDVITEKSFALGAKTQVVDFSDARVPVLGSNARLAKGNIAVLWAGDTNQDDQIIAEGNSNDLSGIMTLALTAPGNPGYNMNFISYGYTEMDVNLDGRSIFSGVDNDLNTIVGNILVFPDNKTSSRNYIISGSLAALRAR